MDRERAIQLNDAIDFWRHCTNRGIDGTEGRSPDSFYYKEQKTLLGWVTAVKQPHVLIPSDVAARQIVCTQTNIKVISSTKKLSINQIN